MANQQGSRYSPRVQLTLSNGEVIDATDLKVSVDTGGATGPISLRSMALAYLAENERVGAEDDAKDLKREFEALGGKPEWDGWGDPPGTH